MGLNYFEKGILMGYVGEKNPKNHQDNNPNCIKSAINFNK